MPMSMYSSVGSRYVMTYDMLKKYGLVVDERR